MNKYFGVSLSPYSRLAPPAWHLVPCLAGVVAWVPWASGGEGGREVAVVVVMAREEGMIYGKVCTWGCVGWSGIGSGIMFVRDGQIYVWVVGGCKHADMYIGCVLRTCVRVHV